MEYSHIKGLTNEEVQASIALHGKNSLPPPEIETFWDKLVDNLQDPLVRILSLALLVTVILSFAGYADWVEALGIATAVLIATVVSTYSEYKNESSFQKQQEEASKVLSNVYRNGKLSKILVGDVVVGDYVLLQVGDKIPADGHLITGELEVNQSPINGEPLPVLKTKSDENFVIPEVTKFNDHNTCFRGSLVESGEAILVVDRVGGQTEYGKTNEELASGDNVRKSPLQVKLANLADGISYLGYMGAIFVSMSFLFKQFVMDQGYSWNNFIIYISNWQIALQDAITSLILSIILIVVAVPEGLPMMIAIVLSLNMRKLLGANVLVRKLLGIETSGGMNILFSDKTGTLTKGILEGQLFITHHKTYSKYLEIPVRMRNLLSFCLKASTFSAINPDGTVLGGNASERAFLSFLDRESLTKPCRVRRNAKILFSSSLKFAGVDITADQYPREIDSIPERISIFKGAPERLLPLCSKHFLPDCTIAPLSESELYSLESECERLSHDGVRVVALCISNQPLQKHPPSLPNDLILVGTIGILDTVRPEARRALRIAKSANIQVVMITGDRKETAAAVARQIDLIPVDTPLEELEKQNVILTSEQLRAIDDDHKLREIIPSLRVIARALPTDKSRLVRVAQSLGLVVGMTGDGVNDAAALKIADVGFGMGSGTEVAKEASDIVILDDNIQSIMSAVLYGRTIFKSIRKFIVFQSTVNLSSSVIVFLGPFLGFDFPLTLIQLLWVNLVMDTLAALAFGGEAAKERYMHEKPIRRSEPIINMSMWTSIFFNGIFIATLCIIVLMDDYFLNLFVRDQQPSSAAFLTAFFAFFIFLTNFNTFNVRTTKINIFDSLFTNVGFILVIAIIFVVQITFTYVGGSVLRTVPLYLHEWTYVIGASLIIIPFDMIRKYIFSFFLTPDVVIAEFDKEDLHED